jgi:hypothetical protein
VALFFDSSPILQLGNKKFENSFGFLSFLNNFAPNLSCAMRSMRVIIVSLCVGSGCADGAQGSRKAWAQGRKTTQQKQYDRKQN